MLVTDRSATKGRDLVDVVEAAVAGGVGLVQVRERDLVEVEVEALLQRLLDRLRGADARLIVNGHPSLACALGIGLHLPAAALPATPRPALLGRSVHDEGEARRARDDGASYVVAGPIFPTGSKPGHSGAGLALISKLVHVLDPMPIFAIGGLKPEQVGAVLEAGASGVAVRSAILGAVEPARIAREFADALIAAPPTRRSGARAPGQILARAGGGSGMLIENALASVAVTSIQTATAWYAQLIGRPADSTPMPEVAEWKFPRGGWLQVYQLPERAGRGSFTLAVTDLDEVTARVGRLGIDTSRRTANDRVRTLMIADPDGNHIALAEALDRTMAR
jgi:thiamine-phosphate diphosphorylase